MLDAEKIFYCRRFLRQEYAGRLPELKALNQKVFATATKEVTLTTASFEGGSGAGTVTFDKMILLAAIGDLIAEWDTGAPPEPPPGGGFVQQFSSL